jgi:hypothetical protein
MKVRDMEQLKMSLKLYKDSLGDEMLKVKKEAQVPPAFGQIRVLFWMPEEYFLIYHVEDSGLVHVVPMTSWVRLSTVPLRVVVDERGTELKPLPFHAYLREELVLNHSYPLTTATEAVVKAVLRAVDRSPTWSAWRPVREFLRLVWKRWEGLTLGSLFYTHDLREKKGEG